jgi:hypothetical protein
MITGIENPIDLSACHSILGLRIRPLPKYLSGAAG